MGTSINSETSLRPKPNRCHRTQKGLERSTVHPNLKSTLDRNESLQNYTDKLFKLRSLSNSSTVPIPNSIKCLLKDSKFQNYFNQILSYWNSHKENKKDVKFKIIELQRKLVQVLLQIMIDASAHLNQVQKITIFNTVMHFLIDNRNSEHCWAYIHSWVSGICIFIPNLLTWCSSEVSQAQDNSIQLHTLDRVGLFLFVAISKEGSVWK
ncbi:hypothetical protein VP01_8954g1, partial [Puccinia sorghi]